MIIKEAVINVSVCRYIKMYLCTKYINKSIALVADPK